MNVTRVVIAISSLVFTSSPFASSVPVSSSSSAVTKPVKPTKVETAAVNNVESKVQSVQALSTTTVTYVHTDVLGSVIAESNAAGAVIKTTDYKPFGESKDN